MRPICVKCQVEMEPWKNSFVIELMAGDQPYQKRHSDKYGCPKCGVEIVAGFAPKPSAEYWQEHYDAEPADLRYWGSVQDQQRAKGAVAVAQTGKCDVEF